MFSRSARMNKYIFLNDEIKLTFNGCCSIINALLADGILTAAMADEMKEECAAICTEMQG